MRVFKIKHADGETTHIGGKTLIHALQEYCWEQSIELKELESDDEVLEVPEAEWPNIKVSNPEYVEGDLIMDWEVKTLDQYIKEVKDTGILCSTND